MPPSGTALSSKRPCWNSPIDPGVPPPEKPSPTSSPGDTGLVPAPETYRIGYVILPRAAVVIGCQNVYFSARTCPGR
ncbi:hypothetical protein FAGKG844_100086 [Frankia sp. AgKG'84/4]